jgi:transposase
MDARKIKAQEISASGRIQRTDGGFLVPSQSGNGTYSVSLDCERKCTCPDHLKHGLDCKHILAIEHWLANDEQATEPPTERATRPTYRQNWKAYNAASTNERHHFINLLSDLCDTIKEPEAKTGPGRKPIPLRDMIFSAVWKVYCRKASRTAEGELRELAKRGIISRAPTFNSVLNIFDDERTHDILVELLHCSAAPLAAVETGFAFDSSGFSTARYDRWFSEKWGRQCSKAQWVKVHIACGVKTHIITAFLALEKDSADEPQFPELVRQTASSFSIKEAYADKAYGSETNYQAMADVDGKTFIPFKCNATGGIGGLFAKAFHFFSFHREEFLKHYHQRSNIESTLSGVKRKFGDSLLSKTDRALKNEALAKCICYNVWCLILAWYELGVEPVFERADADPDEPRAILKFPPRP